EGVEGALEGQVVVEELTGGREILAGPGGEVAVDDLPGTAVYHGLASLRSCRAHGQCKGRLAPWRMSGLPRFLARTLSQDVTSEEVEASVVAAHDVARRVFEVAFAQQREAEFTVDRVRGRVVDQKKRVQRPMLPLRPGRGMSNGPF